MPNCAICKKPATSGHVVHTDCLTSILHYNEAEQKMMDDTFTRNKELHDENKMLQGAFDDAGLTTEETIEILHAAADGRLGILPCRPGEAAYYAFLNGDTWTYGKCLMVAANAEEYIIEYEYYREGEKHSSMRKWSYVFATEQEASAFAQKKNAERVFIPIGGGLTQVPKE